ncbi:MAG: class I SAM-dependent RNA methyltransferase [Tissierellales bacterium]|jgi:putative N6-adenine-specific DNA methylase|nr:class I SAM-dependent RNA methyltransferase [Tissierellales bacterium]
MEYQMIATSTFGLEAIVKREVEAIGAKIEKVDNGRIDFSGGIDLIPKANLWLRVADRVLLKMGEFRAESFASLFDKTYDIPWEHWITEDANFIVQGKSVKSTLYSVRDCQSIVEKAIVKRLQTKYDQDWFKKTGPRYKVQVAILKDIVTITLDTSGEGLHKRGYREKAVAAPIKETLAAALINLSFWKKDKMLIDPFCGSGTILIEAAMIGKNIAPGLYRNFDSEKWPIIPQKFWKEAKVDALKQIDQDLELNLRGYDIDGKAIEIAKLNAENAGVDDCISFEERAFDYFDKLEDYGVIVTNPPYGERLSEVQAVGKLYKKMGQVFQTMPTWSKYVITSYEAFEKASGMKASKKRKLFNGRLKVDYYQYFGEKPPRKK